MSIQVAVLTRPHKNASWISAKFLEFFIFLSNPLSESKRPRAFDFPFKLAQLPDAPLAHVIILCKTNNSSRFHFLSPRLTQVALFAHNWPDLQNFTISEAFESNGYDIFWKRTLMIWAIIIRFYTYPPELGVRWHRKIKFRFSRIWLGYLLIEIRVNIALLSAAANQKREISETLHFDSL